MKMEARYLHQINIESLFTESENKKIKRHKRRIFKRDLKSRFSFRLLYMIEILTHLFPMAFFSTP